MTDSFTITTNTDGLSLKREGEPQTTQFNSEPEAIEAARQDLIGSAGEVTILNPASGTGRVVKIEADGTKAA